MEVMSANDAPIAENRDIGELNRDTQIFPLSDDIRAHSRLRL
jgi:hypothetical protein